MEKSVYLFFAFVLIVIVVSFVAVYIRKKRSAAKRKVIWGRCLNCEEPHSLQDDAYIMSIQVCDDNIFDIDSFDCDSGGDCGCDSGGDCGCD